MKNNLTKNQSIIGKLFGIVVIVVVLLISPRFFSTQTILKNPTNLLFVGDIMLSRQIGGIINREQDPLYHFLRIAEVTKLADIAFANLESIASTLGENVGSIYSFRAEPDTLKGLVYAGFDVVSVANNHAFDWGHGAFMDSQNYLDKLGIAHVGGGKDLVEARKPVIIERNGTKFAYLAYSEFASRNPVSGVPAVAPLDLELMKEDVASAKNVADVIIVSLHWGTEYATTSGPAQKEIARALIDSGVLIVAGHHPHVIQEVEKYHGGLISYSLGNFIFDQNFSAETREGLMLEVTVDRGEIDSYKSIIVHFNSTFQPYVFEKEG